MVLNPGSTSVAVIAAKSIARAIALGERGDASRTMRDVVTKPAVWGGLLMPTERVATGRVAIK